MCRNLSAKETKCGILKTDCLCDFVTLSFVSVEYSFGLNYYGLMSKSKKRFDRIKREEMGNNYMVSQHISNIRGSL